jgi:hypothetical protein
MSRPCLIKLGFPASWFSAIALALSFLLSCVVASPILIARDASATAGVGPYQLTIQGIVLAVILFVCGIFLLFFGYRNFRMTMFLVGFYVFANVAWIILTNAEPAGTYGSARLTILLVVSLGVGLIAGLFLACCFHLGLWLLGAYGGYVLGLWILAWQSNGVIQQRWGQGLFLGLMALAGFFLTFFFERTTVIFFTSLIGAYSIIFALDIFLNTGFIQSAEYFLDSNPNHQVSYVVSWRVYAMLAALIVLTFIGVAVQFALSRRAAKASWISRYGYGGRYGRGNAAAVEPAAAPRKRRWFF